MPVVVHVALVADSAARASEIVGMTLNDVAIAEVEENS